MIFTFVCLLVVISSLLFLISRKDKTPRVFWMLFFGFCLIIFSGSESMEWKYIELGIITMVSISVGLLLFIDDTRERVRKPMKARYVILILCLVGYSYIGVKFQEWYPFIILLALESGIHIATYLEKRKIILK